MWTRLGCRWYLLDNSEGTGQSLIFQTCPPSMPSQDAHCSLPTSSLSLCCPRLNPQFCHKPAWVLSSRGPIASQSRKPFGSEPMSSLNSSNSLGLTLMFHRLPAPFPRSKSPSGLVCLRVTWRADGTDCGAPHLETPIQQVWRSQGTCMSSKFPCDADASSPQTSLNGPDDGHPSALLSPPLAHR